MIEEDDNNDDDSSDGKAFSDHDSDYYDDTLDEVDLDNILPFRVWRWVIDPVIVTTVILDPIKGRIDLCGSICGGSLYYRAREEGE